MIPQCLYPPRVFHFWHSASRAAGVSVFPSPCWRTIMETNHVLLIVLIEEQRKSCTWDETCLASSGCCTLFSPGASATSPVCCSLKCELVHVQHHHLLSLFWSIRAHIVRLLLYFMCLICISEFLIEANYSRVMQYFFYFILTIDLWEDIFVVLGTKNLKVVLHLFLFQLVK